MSVPEERYDEPVAVLLDSPDNASSPDLPLLEKGYLRTPMREGPSKSRLLVPCLVVLLNLIWSIINLKTTYTWDRRYLVYSPANAIITYHDDEWNLEVDALSKYTKDQSPEVDAAWDRISMGGQVGFITVQDSDLKRINETSVALNDGSGYMVGLEVFHQLHCLNYIRKHLYNSSYNIDPSTENVSADDHLPHCIDSIRMALQCQADVTMIPFKWAKGYLEPWPDFRTRHECRNFDYIRDWAAERQPDLTGKLRHPDLGTVDMNRQLNASALPVHHGHVDWVEEHK